jgi:hypothetical protein
VGAADSTDHEVAHTVQAFMLSSLFGSVNKMAALVPVKDLTTNNIKAPYFCRQLI